MWDRSQQRGWQKDNWIGPKYLCICTFVYVQIHIGVRGPHRAAPKDLCIGLQLADVAVLAGQGTPGPPHLCLSGGEITVTITGLCPQVLGMDLRPHVCAASISVTEPSLQHQQVCFESFVARWPILTPLDSADPPASASNETATQTSNTTPSWIAILVGKCSS